MLIKTLSGLALVLSVVLVMVTRGAHVALLRVAKRRVLLSGRRFEDVDVVVAEFLV